MKKILFFLFVCLLTVCALGEEGGWQAYLMPDGNLRVTNEPCEGKPVTSLTMGRGETKFIEVIGSRTFSFHTTGYYAARVDEDGMLITEDRGSAKIRVDTGTGASVEIKVEVVKKPTSIEFSMRSMSLLPGEAKTLTVTMPKNSGGSVSWFCTDESVALIDDDGTVTAVAPGKCVVTAETYNGCSAECEVNVVMPAPATVRLPEKMTGYACEDLTVKAELSGGYRETVSYLSSDDSIFTVEEDGTLHCLKEGGALLYARASGGGYTSCPVLVLPAAQSIVPETDHLLLYPGGTARIGAVTDGGSGAFSLSSSDEAIAVITEGCRVLAVEPGNCVLTLTAPGGQSAFCALTVLRCPEELQLTSTKEAPAMGDRFTVYLTQNQTALMPVEFVSSAPGIAGIDREGNVYCQSFGAVTLSASCGGMFFELPLEVLPPATELRFAQAELLLGVGDSAEVHPELLGGGGTPVLSVSDQNVARIDSGLLTAVRPGSCTLTASLSNGVRAQLNVKVLPAVQSLTFPEAGIVLGAGDSIRPEPVADEGCFSLLEWSSDSDCAAVGEDGTITAVSPGSAMVTARTVSGVSASVLITVTDEPGMPQLNAERVENRLFTHYLSLKPGEETDLCVRFEGYTSVTYKCVSMDETIAAVTPEGTVQALKTGTARITVNTYCGTAAEILVEVG